MLLQISDGSIHIWYFDSDVGETGIGLLHSATKRVAHLEEPTHEEFATDALGRPSNVFRINVTSPQFHVHLGSWMKCILDEVKKQEPQITVIGRKQCAQVRPQSWPLSSALTTRLHSGTGRTLRQPSLRDLLPLLRSCRVDHQLSVGRNWKSYNHHTSSYVCQTNILSHLNVLSTPSPKRFRTNVLSPILQQSLRATPAVCCLCPPLLPSRNLLQGAALRTQAGLAFQLRRIITSPLIAAISPLYNQILINIITCCSLF